MNQYLYLLILVYSAHLGWGCISAGSKPELPNISPLDENSTTADVWLGSIQFINFWCGIPETSYINNLDKNTTALQRRRRKRGSANAKRVVDLNTFKLDHSFVYFRGTCYEFGPTHELIYSRGGVGRKLGANCPVSWTLQGHSTCSAVQAERLAITYQERYGRYNLILNNCHHFAEWVLQRLVRDSCTFRS